MILNFEDVAQSTKARTSLNSPVLLQK